MEPNSTSKPKSKSKPTPTKRKRKLVIRKKPPPSPKQEQEQEQNLEEVYLGQLSETEKIALKIAHHQLESSFCLEKSIGFLQFKEK